MNILITSGGTSEKIDQVRSITNHSTGQLGKIISKRFLEAGFSVTLVTTPTAVQPKEHPHLRKIFIKDVAELTRCSSMLWLSLTTALSICQVSRLSKKLAI